MTRGIALAGALALAACGGGSEWGRDGSSGTEGGGQKPPAPCAAGVTLRVVGIDPGNVTSLVLSLGGASAAYQAGGSIAVTGLPAAPVGVDESARALAVLHLADLTHEWGHAIVHLTFTQGSAVLGEACGALDLCTAPLSFHVDPFLVRQDACEVFLRLDLARSVTPSGSGFAFLPQFRVVYY